MIKSYRDLEVWGKSLDLASETYRITRSLPAEERFGLTSQMRRAALSVGANLAEGSVRSGRDFKRFTVISRGSAKELEALGLIGVRLGYFEAAYVAHFLEETDRVGRMLWTLGSKLR